MNDITRTSNALVALLRAIQLDTCDRAADEIERLQRELADRPALLDGLSIQQWKEHAKAGWKMYAARAENEPCVYPRADEDGRKGGWTLDQHMLAAIYQETRDNEFAPSEEGIEVVLLAYEKLYGRPAQPPGLKLPDDPRELLVTTARDAGFSDHQWKAMFYESGPYDVTFPCFTTKKFIALLLERLQSTTTKEGDHG